MASFAGELRADGKVCAAVIAALTARDFPHSEMYFGVGLTRPDLFPQWSAKTTEDLRTLVRAGGPWLSILNIAADQRTALAKQMPDPGSAASPHSFGRRRYGNVIHAIGMTRDVLPDERRRRVDEGLIADSTLRKELADLALELADPKLMPSIFPGSQFARMRRTRYVAIDGTTIGATDVTIQIDGPNHGTVSIMSGMPKYIDPILKDVAARLDRAKTATDATARQQDVYAAIYGFYQACPL